MAGGNVNQHVCEIRVDRDAMDPRFLQYFLISREGQAQIARLQAGGNREGLNYAQVGSIEVPALPIAQQREIGRALDAADELAIALERAILKKQAVRKGLAQQLLTGRVRLAGFARDWQIVRLGDHVTYIKTVSLSRAQLDEDSPVRYLHYGDIHTRESVRLPAGEEFMPRAPGELIGTAGMLDTGDLVFADASEDPAGVGKSVEIASVPPEGVIAGSHTIAARFDKDVLADGFKGYLQFIPAFREALLRLAAGTKVLATTRSYISSVELTLPSVEEQRAVAEVLGDADAEIEALQRRLEKTLQIREGMMQELLTGRTRLPVEEVAA